jgi:hypothetical protein
MDWGDVAALSVTTNVADAEPVDAGVKTTLMRHDFPALTVVPQVLVCAKLPAFAPVSAMVNSSQVSVAGICQSRHLCTR